MTREIVETLQGVKAMASSAANHASPAQQPINGLAEGAGSEGRTPKLETLSVESEDSSRSNQGPMRTSSRGDGVANPRVKRGSRRKVETEDLNGGLEAPQRLRLERSAKSKGDSSTKPSGDETNENEGVVESSMFKQVKFENSAASTQCGLTDKDDKAKAFDALADVMDVYGIPKQVVGLAAEFPGEIGVGTKKLCGVCKKPETAKHTIICDKCQCGYHLSCVKLKLKQAIDTENEDWHCGFCGPDVESPSWPLGRITSQHDRKLADPRWEEPKIIENSVVTLPDTATSKGGDQEGPGMLDNLNIPRKNYRKVLSFSKRNITSVKRGRGRPKKDSSALKEKIITNTMVDLGVRDRVLSEEQPAPNLGNNLLPALPTPTISPGISLSTALTPTISPGIPLVGVPDILTTTNDSGIQGDTAQLSDDCVRSEGKETKEPEPMLEDLRLFIADMGLKLEEGWEVIIKHRPSNLLITDKIYISPDGHKFRSRLQVARFLENPKRKTHLQSIAQRINVQPAAQKENLGTPTQRADISLEGLGSSKEMALSGNFSEPQEEREKRIEEKTPIVKESRSLPPAGDLLTRRLPAELVGDTLEVWEFLCRFSDILDLKSPLTYEELETGLVNLGPSVPEDTISNVDVQHSSNPSSGENPEKVCAESGHDGLCKPADHSRDTSVEGNGFTLESTPNSVVLGEDSKAADFNIIDEAVNGLEQGMFLSVEAGGLPQSTTVQKNTDLIPSPTESPPEEKVSATDRAVASSDSTLNENFVMIARTHIPLLKCVLGDLQFRINGNSNVSKSEEPKKKGRKPLHEAPQDIPVDNPEFSSDLPMNEVTWPELVRRYLVTLIEAEKYADLAELKLEDRKWLLRCLQGDGGVPCGALYTVVGVESDAQVLAEAEKELAIRVPKDSEMKEGEDDGSDKLPEWVEALRPIAKMATNVGSRIRIKVKEALELGPPQWAREQLEWSISKDVFKGNASGPTKKAVVEVLNHYDVSPPCESPIPKTKPRRTVPSVDQLMQRCRVVLRTLADADKSDTFSVLIGGPEGHGSRRLRGMVPRPLDFRTIDARLAAGAYGGSVDAFAEDVRQIWRNVELLQKGGEMMELANNLSHIFEDLLQKQVINFMSGVPEEKVKEPKIDVANVLEEGTEPTKAPLTRSHLATAEKPEDKLQKAPWQDNETCRVCGVDEDYESIMLCDKCDAEYHTYCLNPPLENVPEGSWFCPECVALDKGFPDIPSGKDGEVVEPESLEGEDEHFSASLNTGLKKELKEAQGESAAQCLLKQIESKEYWQLGLSERVHLLKFLCNEAVKTTQVHAHLEKSVDLVFDLQQQLNDLHVQRLDNLKTRSHPVKGSQASSTDTWSSRLRHHSSGVLGAEEIRVSMPRTLHFGADGKEDEYLAEGIDTIKGASDLVKEGNHDDATHEVNDVTAPAGLDTLAVFDSAGLLKKRRNDDVKVQEQVGRTEATTPERIMTRNSKRAKFEEHSEGGSEVHEGQTVAPGIDLEVQVKEVVRSEIPGGRNMYFDESAESGRRVALRSSHLSSEHPDASRKIGIAGASLPPRTPKRKLETTSSSETLKKLRADINFNGEGLAEGRDQMSKGHFVGEYQSVVGSAQGIPALGEVIDDPHKDEPLSDPKLDAEIAKVELRLHNATLRREHLGTDDVGREYWALSGPNRLPLLVVSECDGMGRAEFRGSEETYFSYVEQSGRGNSGVEILQSGYALDRSKERKTRWWAYSNEASIDSVVAWLNPRVEVERTLKSSICRWRESKSLIESDQEKVNMNLLGNVTDGSFRKEQDTAKLSPKRFPTLKATSILQMRYGSCSFSDKVSNKKSTIPMEGKVIRCSCLEPLWKFKWHCQACHETYESLAELESHKNNCPEGAATHSSGKKQKGSVSGRGKITLTPEKAKKTATSEKGKKKSKSATPKKEGTKRSLEREGTGVHTCEENSWMSDDSTEPSTLHRPVTRGKGQAATHLDDDPDINGDFVVSEGLVEDAFFLSDFQDDVPNSGMDYIEQEDFRMGYGSFSSLLQDDEWEANLRPERSELKRKKHGSGKKSSKQPPTQGTSEMALANFDYASLAMTFSTPDSTRDRILQIGLADQGPTFAPALHFAPAFDPSLMIQPCYPDPNESSTDAGEFPGSSPLPSSQNGSSVGDLNPKDFVEGGLDAVSWYDPQTSGDVKPEVAFMPDTGDTEPVVQPGSGVSTWDLAELVGLHKTEFGENPAPLIDSGEVDHALNEQTIHFCASGDGNQLNGEEAVFSTDERQPESVESVDLVPALPARDVEVPLEIAPAVVKTVQDMSLKKQAKKFAAPETSLRPLVGEHFGILIGLKMRLLDMEAAMGVEALVPPKSAPARRRAWRSFVKSSKCIYEMTKAVIILEQMVRPDCLKRTWCHWSSLSSAARSATLSTLALRIFALDAAITYKKDKVIAEELQRPSTLKKPKKKIQSQVPLSSKTKKTSKAG